MEYTYFLPVPHHLSQIGLILDHYPCLLFFQKTIEAVHLLLFIKLKFSLIVLRVVRAILAPKKLFFFFWQFAYSNKTIPGTQGMLISFTLAEKANCCPKQHLRMTLTKKH